MITIAALTLLAVAPAEAPTCELTDNACKAQQFIDKSRTAPPGARALYLYTAHRSYLALFAQTGKVQDLCAARASFDRSVGVQGQSEGQRASFEAARAELEALEQQFGARCGVTAKRRKRVDATPVAALTPAAGEGPIEGEPPPLLVEPGGRDRADPKDRLAAARVAGPPLADAPVGPTPARPVRPPGRGLVIAGGATLGVGLVLGGIAGYAGSQLAGLARASQDLYENARGQALPEVVGEDSHLRGTYRQWLPVTVAATIAGSSALVVGAVLVRLGVRRHKDGPSRTALVPVPGGLAIHARF